MKGVQVSESGLRLLDATGSREIPLADITGWQFIGDRALFTTASDDLSLRFSASNVQRLRAEFNAARMAGKSNLQQCPDCDLLSPADEGPVSFCPECFSMFRGEESLCRSEGYTFNFCDDGRFALVGPIGSKVAQPRLIEGAPSFRSLRAAARPLVQRLTSHLYWLALWACLAFFYPVPATLLIFLSLFLMASYATVLFLRGVLKPLIFPPMWEATHVRGEKVEDPTHPGHLANAGDLAAARALCPSHPALVG